MRGFGWFPAAVVIGCLAALAACGGDGEAADALEFHISSDGLTGIDIGYDAETGGDPGEDAPPPADADDPGAQPDPAEDPGTPPDTVMPDPGQDPAADPAPDPSDPGVGDPPIADEAVAEEVEPPDFGPCDPAVTQWGYEDNCDGTVTDTKSGRTWTKGMAFASGFDAAFKYCKELTLDGGGWHLPKIHELRSLIIGCDATDEGGACPVADGCINDSCWSQSACGGCGMSSGPGADGCYLDPVFDKNCNLFWSGSQYQAASGIKRSWYVTFYDARVFRPNPGDEGSWALRCVR
jgi:hypothetical protein